MGDTRWRGRPLRVLMLGQNVASQMSITVQALRKLGVEADGFVWDASPIVSDDGLRRLNHGLTLRARLGRGLLSTSSTYALSWGIHHADVIHWNYGTPAWRYGLDLRLARLLRRPGVVEFWGSDVRIGEVAVLDNPYYAARRSQYEYERHETREASYARQDVFARQGVRMCLAPPWFDRYIKPGLFAQVHESFARLMLENFPANTGRRADRPIIVHAPSATGAKGTDAVLAAVERLRACFDFEFRLLHGMPRRHVLDTMRDCDIYLDQFVLGEYGMAALEAMAFGKPAVCYLRQDVVDRSPGRLPIVNATIETLFDRTASLLSDPEQRSRIGEESRRYIEAHHDALKHAANLTSLYHRLLGGES